MHLALEDSNIKDVYELVKPDGEKLMLRYCCFTMHIITCLLFDAVHNCKLLVMRTCLL